LVVNRLKPALAGGDLIVRREPRRGYLYRVRPIAGSFTGIVQTSPLGNGCT